MPARLARGDTLFRVARDAAGRIRVADGADSVWEFRVRRIPGGALRAESGEDVKTGRAVRDGDTIWVHVGGRTYRFQILRGTRARPAGAGDLASPMPGRVQKVLVREGAQVNADDPLLVVEAMKMQLEIKAPRAGTVSRLLVGEGDQVAAGAPLVEMEAEAS